ncbi:MAG: threonine/serine dehydratase [Alphaproteobacteria bacterium]|nr:threonine/serine dehydratase [Alphaproteobacteria bacterium]
MNEIRAAARRIRGYVRQTPLISAAPAREYCELARGLSLKLESLQVAGSFKARGAINAALGFPGERLRRGVVTASGGNHGLAVAYAGWATGAPATIFLPRSVAPDKVAKLDTWGARVVISGEAWDDSNRAARHHAEAEGLAYIHPFADPAVIAGQGTVALEILAQDPDVGTLLVAIGGGGLISGIALAAKALSPAIRIIGVEPKGAPTLHDSIAAGRLVELASLGTAAVTLAPRRSEPLNFTLIRQNVERIVLVEEDQMREAARWLWRETGTAAELSGAAAVAALLAGRYRPAPGERVCAVVCGAGTDGFDRS